MKIIELNAENIKRLTAVEIHPDETVQIIGGNNGQGKSSVLDAIWLALGGGAAKKSTARPIRDGEKKAKVTLDLGDLKVTRTWTSNDKSVLKVESVNGAQFKSPQAMLDKLVGKFSFDPLAFTQLSAKEQRQQLINLVDLDVDVDTLDAEQIRVSLAMAMAMNPELRVIRIMDGSLLDENNLALIRQMATDNDFQVWIERVGKADEGAVIIEEGKVK